MVSERHGPKVIKKSGEPTYTKIPNKILEFLMAHPAISEKYRILLCLIRMTLGYHRKWAELNYGLIHLMTGIAKPHISRAIHDLMSAKLIRRKGKPYHSEYTLKTPQSITNLVTLSDSPPNCYRSGNQTVTKSVKNYYQPGNPYIKKEINKGKKVNPASDSLDKSEPGFPIEGSDNYEPPPEEFKEILKQLKQGAMDKRVY